MRLFAPNVALLSRPQIEQRCACTGTIGTSVEKNDFVSLFPSEAICLGFKFLSVDDEQLIVVSDLNFIALAA